MSNHAPTLDLGFGITLVPITSLLPTLSPLGFTAKSLRFFLETLGVPCPRFPSGARYVWLQAFQFQFASYMRPGRPKNSPSSSFCPTSELLAVLIACSHLDRQPLSRDEIATITAVGARLARAVAAQAGRLRTSAPRSPAVADLRSLLSSTNIGLPKHAPSRHSTLPLSPAPLQRDAPSPPARALRRPVPSPSSQQPGRVRRA